MEGGYGGPGLDEVPELEGADEFDPFEVVECIEEIVKNVPEAPSETQWYHGRLDRAIAEERLRQSGKPGSYLIRESDRRPGSFVLSFYGRTGMDHFKVTSVCGAFYIGGREFESLSLLIGYYTGWSDLLKGERLQHPVPPPDFVQPVFRRKRVRAVSSYTKSPETDELSFVKGEMFVVHNDLGDDWVWVTSLLTDDSGIINQKLVQSIPDDVDPVEQFPWFHPNISKEEAAEKLAASGPGSWLVKKSDSTEGDFSIYFYCKDQIQRFKIKRTSASYFMGGRTFKSVSEVVKRYQNEQIVEGYSLQKPVYRVAELSPEPSDLTSKEQTQTSIKQSTGSNFFLNKKDVIVIKGRLNKKTQKTKKWKRMYFVLNGTEQQLYYFDSEKRSKPKGLIDLSFASIYPVHDSLFGRPNVFQVFSRGLNQASLCYLCADSVDDAQEWVRSLKSYCCNTRIAHNLPQNIPNPVLTELRSLRVKIFELSQPLPKHFSQPYCVVSLNEFKVCRTRVVQGENCCWDEEFAIEDIPADINSFNISIYNKELIKDREISSLKFSISEVNSDKMIEDRFVLPSNSSTSKTDRGTLRIGYQYLHEKIMSLHEYAKLKDLLLKNNMEYVLALTSTCDDYHERASLSTSLLHLFRHEKQEKLLLIKFLEIDLEMEEGKERLFRGETFGTTMMDQYMKMVSTTFLQHALQDTINKILKQMSETNSSEDLNPKCIISHLTDVVHNISSSVKYVPTVLRHVCHFLQRKVSEKWPDDSLIRTRVISAFIFLRLICPAMINPRQFNLITETPSQMAVKTLKHVAKCLIKLANLTDCKEAGMESVNHFINENKKMIVSFADGVSNVPNASNMSPPCTMDVSRCLASIHRFCNAHLEKLKKMSQSQPSVANLVAVTESLTSRKRQNVKKE